jgi:hypothetical protein
MSQEATLQDLFFALEHQGDGFADRVVTQRGGVETGIEF